MMGFEILGQWWIGFKCVPHGILVNFRK